MQQLAAMQQLAVMAVVWAFLVAWVATVVLAASVEEGEERGSDSGSSPCISRMKHISRETAHRGTIEHIQQVVD